jgi:hypothetical protein
MNIMLNSKLRKSLAGVGAVIAIVAAVLALYVAGASAAIA